MMKNYKLFENILTQHISEVKREYKFDSKRKLRFDFCFISEKIAIEIEGGIFTKGRHTRGKGFLNDMEKYNKAQELGYIVLRYSPDQLLLTDTFEQIKRVYYGRKEANEKK